MGAAYGFFSLWLCCQLQFAGGNFEVAFLHFRSVMLANLAAVAEAEPLAGSVMMHRYFHRSIFRFWPD